MNGAFLLTSVCAVRNFVILNTSCFGNLFLYQESSVENAGHAAHAHIPRISQTRSESAASPT